MKSNQEVVNIKVCIFYAKHSWHVLIKKLIKPLLKKLEGQYTAYHIFFKNLNGDHIQLDIYVYQINHEKVLMLLKKQLDCFLTSYPSKSEPVSFPLKGFFVDFPLNTFFVSVEDINVTDKRKFNIRSAISNILINKFEKEVVDLETVLSLALYFHLSLVKILHNNNYSTENAYKLLLGSTLGANKLMIEEIDKVSFDLMLKDNVSLATRMLSEIPNSIQVSENSWLGEWTYACSLYIDSMVDSIDCCNDVLNVIEDHICLPQKQIYFIYKLACIVSGL